MLQKTTKRRSKRTTNVWKKPVFTTSLKKGGIRVIETCRKHEFFPNYLKIENINQFQLKESKIFGQCNNYNSGWKQIKTNQKFKIFNMLPKSIKELIIN